MDADMQKFNAMVKSLEPSRPDPIDEDFKTLGQMAVKYKQNLIKNQGFSIDLSKWLWEFAGKIKPLPRGAMVVITADTGTGKTAILQSIAKDACAGVPTIFFEAELSDDMMYERVSAMTANLNQWDIEALTMAGKEIQNKGPMDHVTFVTRTNLTVETIRKTVLRYNATHDKPCSCVMVDYIGLVGLDGPSKSRYEKTSDVAEQLRPLAKDLDVVMFITSQVHRKEGDEVVIPKLHSSKDSGSIESSAYLLLGAWREGDHGEEIKLRILKTSNGFTGSTVTGHFDGGRSYITNQLSIPQQKPKKNLFGEKE